VMMIMWD